MKKQTRTIEIGNGFRQVEILYAMDDSGETPRPGDGDETVDPNTKDPNEEEEGEVKPGNF